MSRYGFNVDDVEIVVGWDNPCQTFFGSTEVNGVPVIDTMLDMGRFDVKDIRLLECMIGFNIPVNIQNKLIMDRASGDPQSPLQRRLAEVFGKD